MIDFAPSRELAQAIEHARRVRCALLRVSRAAWGGGSDLAGFCVLASLMLAHRIGNLRSLRASDGWIGFHAFNVVDGVIVDITATQFASVSFPDVPTCGVMVTSKRGWRWFHRTTARGRAVLVDVLDDAIWIEDYAKSYSPLPRLLAELERMPAR